MEVNPKTLKMKGWAPYNIISMLLCQILKVENYILETRLTWLA